jgi:hypothetical protein
MPNRYSAIIVQEARIWCWSVLDQTGRPFAHGIQPSRAAAVLAAENAIWKLRNSCSIRSGSYAAMVRFDYREYRVIVSQRAEGDVRRRDGQQIKTRIGVTR